MTKVKLILVLLCWAATVPAQSSKCWMYVDPLRCDGVIVYQSNVDNPLFGDEGAE